MSTALSSGAPHSGLPVLDPKTKVAIVTAEWNSHVTEALTDGAVTLLKEQGVAYDCYHVPGAVELTYGAAALVKEYDAVIVFGCVIRGGTPHFDYVCDSVTQGVSRLNAKVRRRSYSECLPLIPSRMPLTVRAVNTATKAPKQPRLQ